MARGGWRRQPRDARGRFASYGYAGQTGGRGARMKSGGNTRDGGGAKMQAARPAGTIKKPAGLKPGSIKPKPVARGDGASVNRKMSGSRGKALDAEITRNVNAQKAANRAASKARNRQFKSDQSRAKKLRDVHGATLAKSYAAKSGKSAGDVMNAIKGMSPSNQIKLFQKYVKENRK